MRITHYRIRADFELTAAVLADFHSSAKSTDTDGILDMIRQEKPDMIFSPGDVFNHADTSRIDDRFNAGGLSLLSGVVKIAPLFYSVGNHEHGVNAENRALLEKAGVTVLDNGYMRTGDIVIGGLTSGYIHDKAYYKGKQPVPDVSMLDGFAAEDGYKILLCHHPEYWTKYIAGRGVDLTISGHAHGGQWGFFGGRGVYAPGQGLFPKYVSGLHCRTENGRRETLAVSRGMTNTVPVPRFFNPCEILILHFGKDGG